MAMARSLADLMKIRAHNQSYLDTINGNLGTALGFKKRSGEPLSDQPAVIVFVPEKVHRKWLPSSQLIKEELRGPNNLRCPLDVVAGAKAEEESVVPESGTALAQRLRGWDERIWCGSHVESSSGSEIRFGSLGLFAKRKSDDICGCLTNSHVAIGDDLFHPRIGMTKIGSTDGRIVEAPIEEWYGEFAATERNAKVRVDAAFIRLEVGEVDADDLSLEALVQQENGTNALPAGPFGDPIKIDLDKELSELNVIGRPVFHVGRTTGLRKGEIGAFAYEWKDQRNLARYTDLLIKGETVPIGTGFEQTIPFSYKGDSGTVIFAVENRIKRPIGLLWGGWEEQLRGGESQENWSYASRIDRVLDALDLVILKNKRDLE